MGYEVDHSGISDLEVKEFPHFIEDGTGLTADGGNLIIIATSEHRLLYVTGEGASFLIRRELITSSESVGPHIVQRGETGQVVGIDLLGPPPYLFRRTDLQVSGTIVDELTRGLRLAARPYRILHGEMHPTLEKFEEQLIPFPHLTETETIR